MIGGPALAREYVEFAREHTIGKLRAELQVDGDRYEVVYERRVIAAASHPEDGQGPSQAEEVEETITVKRGSKSRPQILFAAPAEWVMDGRAT